MKALKKLIFAILCLSLFAAFMHTAAFACSADDSVAEQNEAFDEPVVITSDLFRVYDDVGYASSTSAAGIKLNTLEKYFYSEIENLIVSVASGSKSIARLTVTSGISDFSWTKEELGGTILNGGSLTTQANNTVVKNMNSAFDVHYILSTLLVEYPYEMFWFDKTGGIGYTYEMSATSNNLSIASITFFLYVSDDYSNPMVEYGVSQSKISEANSVLAKINAIVEEHKDKGDYEKLAAYKDEICDLVSYNFDALKEGTAYGNPWQLIYVFDDNPNTNVVCEGYAKAFKYLCDLSEFDRDIYCYITTGEMISNKSENHMWNIVKIGGSNYIVDVTNTDYTSGSGGFNLFLVGGVASNSGKTYTVSVNGNSIKSIKYVYAESQKNLFCEDYLVISGSEYQNHIDQHSFGSKWVTDGEGHWHECSCGARSEISIHTPASAATCVVKAVCAICNEEYGNLTEHSLTATGECRICGYTEGTFTPDDEENDNVDDDFEDSDEYDDEYEDDYDNEYDDDYTYDEEEQIVKPFYILFIEWLISFLKWLFGIKD